MVPLTWAHNCQFDDVGGETSGGADRQHQVWFRELQLVPVTHNRPPTPPCREGKAWEKPQ